MDYPLADHKTRLNLRNAAWRGTLVTVAAAIVLVFLAPVMDHHFVERQHNHSHIFLTATFASQSHPDLHPFEQAHFHVELTAQRSDGGVVIYQTSNDGLRESGSVFFTAVLGDGLNESTHDNDTLSLALIAGEGNYQETVVTPPTRPPRA